jgi:sigma-E factor negative regulatory protein RseA
MKQDISALMDGELFDDEAEALLDDLKGSPDKQAQWGLYHLIGDALRQPDHLHANIAPRFSGQLRDEPTVLAPRNRTRQHARWFALSAAASVLALTLVAWMSMQIGSEPAGAQMAVQQPQTGEMRPASYSGSSGMNDYLMAHQEFSPSNDMQGGASYIRTVAGQ